MTQRIRVAMACMTTLAARCPVAAHSVHRAAVVAAAAVAMAMYGATAGAQAPAQTVPFIAAATTEGIALRWAWGPGERPRGWYLERREGTGAWTRLNTTPIAPVRDRTRVQSLLGAAFDRYADLLFPADPLAALREAESRESLLLLGADVEPPLALVLGLRYDDRAVRAGTQYEYRLVALERAGERVVATSAPVAAGSFVPASAPAPLEARQSPAGVELRWTPRAEYTAYNVYRGVGDAAAQRINDGPVVIFEVEAGVSDEASVTHYRDAAPPSGGLVRYAVEGIDAFGRTGTRTEAVVVELRDVVAPAPPSRATATVRGDTVVVAWPASPSPDVVAYRVWRTVGGDSVPEPVSGPVGADARELLDPARPAARVHFYHVTAVDAAGNESAPSFRAIAEVPDLVPPPAPAELVGEATVGLASLSWSLSPAADVRGYRVYRTEAAGREFGLLTPEPIATPRFDDTLRTRADHFFYYRVTAVDSAFNESAPSIVLALRPPDAVPPSAPRIVHVRPGEERLLVSWLPNPEPDVVAYRVQMRERGTAAWRTVIDSVSADTREATVAGVLPRTLVEVAMVAVDDAGNISSPSRPVAAESYRRRAPRALDVRGAAFDARAGGIVITWRPAPDAAAEVVVLRRQAGDSVFVRIARATAAAARFVDVHAPPGVAHEYALIAVDPYGNLAAPGRSRSATIPASPAGGRP